MLGSKRLDAERNLSLLLSLSLGPQYILFPGLAGALVLVAVSLVTTKIKASLEKTKKA